MGAMRRETERQREGSNAGRQEMTRQKKRLQRLVFWGRAGVDPGLAYFGAAA